MANRFVQMWRWQGTIDRGAYAIAGCSAFVLKYFLDKFVAFAWFGRPWYLWSYWQPLGPGARVNALPSDTRVFATTHWLARVYRGWPFNLIPGLMVNSSVQL